MGTVATTTASDPLGVPANTRVDRDPQTGYLYAFVRSTTANTWDLYRSTNGGTGWSLHLSLLRSNVQEMGSTFIGNDGHLYLSYRTNESSQDRIYFRRCRLNNPVWGPETLTGQPANGGTAGSIHQGMDIQLVGGSGRWMRIVIAVGTTFGGTSGITLYGVLLDQPAGTHTYNNNFLTGRRQWMDITGTGRIVPSVDIEHDGSGKGSDVPHLWIAYGRDVLRMVKLSWTGAAWSGPATTQLLQTGLAAQDGITGRWDGERWLMPVPHPTATDTVLLVERNRGNTSSVLRQTPPHPAGVVRTVGLSYSRTIGRSATAATRLYAVGTANPDLHYVDYVRETGLWTSWTTVTATDVLGTVPNQFSVRRGSVGYARHDLAIAHATPTPNTVVSYQQTVTYAPDTPTWDETAIGVNNGSAAEVTTALNLDWVFSDPDPGDAQAAWALSRQIGGGALAYLRTSDGTWQATEQKNAGATTARTLAAGWGLTSDAPHSYKVKVWDSADTASLYSDAFVVLPSGKANPTVTSPTEGATIATDQVTVTWTAAEQTAFRVQLLVFAEVHHDSGWRSGTDTTYTVPNVLANGFNHTVQVQTRNLKGLASDGVNRNFSVAFVEPPRPSLAVNPQPDAGVMRVTVTNPPPLPILNANPYFEAEGASAGGSNPGFETGTASAWSVVSGTIAASQDVVKVGAWAGKLTADGAANPRATHSQSGTVVTAGEGYTISGWLYAPSALPSTASITIQWYTAAGAFISQNVLSAALTPGTWTYLEGSFAAPVTAALAARQFSMNGTPAAGVLLYGDDVQVRAAKPANWSAAGGTVVRSTAQAHEGVASLLLTPDGVTASVEARADLVPATAGQAYRASSWVRCAVARTVAVGINWHESGGAFISQSVTSVAVTANTWTLLDLTATAPALTGQARLLAGGMAGTPPASHTLHIDEASIQSAAEPAFASQDLWRRPVVTPILNANPTFDTDASGWGSAVGGTGGRSTEQAKSGGWSYKVTPSGSSGIAYAETVKLPCTEGVTYDAYGWVHAVTAAKPTSVHIRWFTAAGALISASLTETLPPAAGVWRYRSQLAQAPAGATQMTLCAGVGGNPAATDIVYVDELRIRVADGSNGIRVAAGVPAGGVVDDWRAVSGVEYEYRAVVRAANGASGFGPWTP